MKLMISLLATPTADALAITLRNRFQDMLADRASKHVFRSKLSGVVVFAALLDAARGSIPNGVVLREGGRVAVSTFNGPHDSFLASDASGRVRIFTDTVRAALENVDGKLLTSEDRDAIIRMLEGIRNDLLAELHRE